LYDVSFLRQIKFDVKTVSVIDNLYADMLESAISEETGLLTRLF
jgi:hypothetical protein